MLLIWHRPYWEAPIVDEVKSVEIKTRVVKVEGPHWSGLQTTIVAEIVSDNGERSRLGLEHYSDHIIVIDGLKGDDFKVLL